MEHGDRSNRAKLQPGTDRESNLIDSVIESLSELNGDQLALLTYKLKRKKISSQKTQSPPLVPAPRDRDLPLSFAQQRLWFLDQLAPNNPFYNNPGAVRIEGRVDIEALERSVNEIVRRHEVLRTRIEVKEGEPIQVIDQWKRRRLEVEDLTSLTREEREEEARRIASAEAEAGFDLSRGPLLRVKVLKLGEEEHALLFTMHHIVSDGWSMEILSREVGMLYQAYGAGVPSPLPELNIQYADYAVWQRNWLQGEALQRRLSYWREQLAGMEELELPTDHPRPAVRSYRGASRRFAVEREVAEKLRALGQQQAVTLFMTLLGGFDVLMSRYSGQGDVVVGTDIASRNRAEIEGLIGFFINQLVLRVEVRAQESFRVLLGRVREVTLGGFAHQDVPFEKLVEELQPERDLSRSPLFQAKLLLQHAPREGLELGGVRLTNINGEETQARIDLWVQITDTGHDLLGTVTYSRDLFEKETIERLTSHFTNLLKEIAEDSERPISELNLLSDWEREQMVVEWNRTARTFHQDRRIDELFTEQAERVPDRIALICEGVGLSYRELNRRANQLGRRLQSLGVGPEVVVGLCLERSVEMVVALMGVLKSGGAYLPLDPELPLERLGYMLEDAGAGVVLTERELENRLPSHWGQTVLLDEEWGQISREGENNPQSGPESDVESENLAYIIYTSGSTGKPKGVMVRHRSLANYTQDICRQLGLSEDGGERGLQFATVSTITADLGNTCIYPSLVSGGCLHVLSYEAGTDGGRFGEYLRNHPIDVLKIVPSHLGALLATQPPGVRMLPHKYLILGGEALSCEMLEQIKERGEGCEVINHYGPTETTVGSLTSRVEEEEESRKRRLTVPIGRPIANTKVYLLDRDLKPVPMGARGGLYIAGLGVARGYWGKPELTAERFIPNPLGFDWGERLYWTGDVCRYLTSRKVEFVGRADQQVKLRGHRIELGEIESVLNEHRCVKQSVVIAREDGRGGKRLIGYVVAEEGASSKELRRHLKEKLPEYMAPDAILVLEEMPITANGKIDRKRLPNEDAGGSQFKQEYVSARTAVEEIVVGLFEEALRLDRVGVEDNFFEIGGHSLLATQVVSRVRKTFGVEIGVGKIFEEPTAKGLARGIDEAMRAGEMDEAPPLVRASREDNGDVRLPLSFAQQRLWFLDQLAPNNPFYNIPYAMRLEGRLRLELLERVIKEIIRRHEALRSRIEVDEGEPAHVIGEWEHWRLLVEDLTGRVEEEREAEIRRMAREEAATRFDLSRGPLIRVKALKVQEEEYVALVTMHHIVSDAWSMGVLLREICALYEAMSEGKKSPLPELEIQYTDYARWQRKYLAGSVMEREVEYWKEQLKDLVVIQLPTDHARPAAPSHRGDRERIWIAKELGEDLRRLCQREGATLFMVLMAAFKVVLMKWSGEEDLCVGTSIANRTRKEVEGLIGFFVNTLVIRTALGGNPSFRELVNRERTVALGAYGHQELPFEKLVEAINPDRDLSRSPLFQIMMELQNTQREELKISGLKVKEVGEAVGTAKFDLTLTLTDGGEGIAGSLEYSLDLYERETVRRMARHYEKVLQEVVRDAEQRIREIELLSGREREQILLEWNGTAVEYPRNLSIHELFEAQAERTPEAAAVVFQDQILTYRELNARANQLARALVERGVGPEVLVSVLAERGLDFLITMLAVFKAGGAYFPLDPRSPATRIGQTLGLSGAKLVITTSQFEARAAEAVAVLNPENPPAVCLLEELLKVDRQRENLGIHSLPGQLAYVIFTSGSTGTPKGAMVEQQGMINHLFAKIRDLTLGDRDVVAQTASQCFDISVWQFLAALLVSGHAQIFDDETTHDPASLLDQVEQKKVTILEIVPSMMRMMLAEADNRGIKPDLSALRWLIPTGEALPPELCRLWFRLYPEIPLLNAYGPTECSDDVTHCLIDGVLSENAVRSPIGSPIANTQIYTLNAGLEPQPIGVVGELYVGGEGVGRGYLNAADKTAECFLPDRFAREAGARLYRSGDLARYLSNGNLEYLGRIDHQVKIRGFRIELGEIEAALRRHPSIEEVVVLAREDAPGEKRLAAYLVAKPGKALSINELRDSLRRELPEYMSPAAYVMLDALPLTANGKLDRRALPVPDGSNAEKEQGYAPPRTPTEKRLSEIWSQVLGVARVGVNDDFFEVGGHSLLATQAISRIRAVFKIDLPLRALFEHPKLNELARTIDQASKAGRGLSAPPLVRASRDGRLPLSFAQQRLWFLDQLAPNNPFYNIPGAVKLEGRLDLEALGRVINEIVRRHESLRTRIEVADGTPVQLIDEWKRRELEVIDLTNLTPERRAEEASRITSEEARAGFNLSRGPLFRVKALNLEEEDHVLLFTMHHIVSDGWSMEILSREVGMLYSAYSRGESSPLEELPIQYADFAVWQRQWLQREALEEELEYWRKQLAGMEAAGLPTDHPRPAVQSYRGARQQFVVERQLTEKLRELGQREGVTMFMTLLGGFDVLLSRYSGREDVTLGTDIAGRNRVEIEGLIGFFINQLVLRVEVRARETFRTLLKRVREVCLGAYAHQNMPFEKLVEELQPERDLSRSPLFQTKLIWENAPREVLELGGMRLSSVGSREAQSRFDLAVFITDAGRELAGDAIYSRDLFEEATIERLMSHYMNVLRGIVESERPISELSLLSDHEREQVVAQWNQTGRVYPQDRYVHELIAEQAERNPGRMALVCDGEQLSYGELNRRSNQLGHYLRGLGVGPEVVVGVGLERSVAMVVAVLGVLKAGGAYLPLDASYPLERLSFMLEDAGVGVVLTDGELAERLPGYGVQTVLLEEEWERICRESEIEPASGIEAENLAYVIFTSGSTGRPKGVMINHRGFANYLKWATETYRIEEGEGAPVQSSIGFDLTVTSLFGPLVSGRSANLLSEEEGIESLGNALGRESGYSLLKLTPSHVEVLAQQMGNSEVEGRARVMVIGGEALGVGALKYWRERAPSTRLINEYGPTETVVGCCVYEVDGSEFGSEIVPIGKPIANTQIYVLDREFEPAPIGARGEIYISGAGLARGYIGKPDLTGERFVPNGFCKEGGERAYRTGDMGRYLTDGNIVFMGRADSQVKVRGYRIELDEIRAVLDEHRSVKQAVVIASDNDRGGKRLLGYVVGEAGVTAAELKGYLKQRLPEYMVPEAIMVLKEFPLTTNGKIDRKRLPSVKEAAGELAQAYVAPRTPVEEILAGIFEDVLQLNRVGRGDNFFELGGHSLLATQVVSRVRNAFGAEIGVRSIFEEPVVERLASRIEMVMRSGEEEEILPLVKVSREGKNGVKSPLSFAQRRLWFNDQLNPDNSADSIPVAVRIEGRLDLVTLESVINAIVRRHEALRTRIEEVAGEPLQVIEDWGPRNLEVNDLTGLTPEEREESVSRVVREGARAGFDLRRGPLVRVKVLKLEEEEHVLFFAMHRIVSDERSARRLTREVGRLYETMNEGNDSPLPELEIQYADYAFWQRQYLTGAVLEKHLVYWKKQLGGKMPAPVLIADHTRPSGAGNFTSYQGEAKSFPLSAELHQSLKALSRRGEATLSMVLLAAFKTLLYRYTAQEDIIVGFAVANRNQAKTGPLIGFFEDMLPMRTNLGGNPRFMKLLGRVKEVVLGGYTYQELPFDKLVEEIQPESAVKNMPLFNIAFEVQDVREEEPSPTGIKIRPMVTAQKIARFDLALRVAEGAGGIQICWTYRKDLFDEGTVTRMHSHFETLLFNIVDRPDSRLISLKVSSRTETSLSHQEQDDLEDSKIRKLMSVKRKGVNLPTEPAR
jgi:amino acid adenylation domain-containing protein